MDTPTTTDNSADAGITDPPRPVLAFANIGGSCFLNSLLACLTALPAFMSADVRRAQNGGLCSALMEDIRTPRRVHERGLPPPAAPARAPAPGSRAARWLAERGARSVAAHSAVAWARRAVGQGNQCPQETMQRAFDKCPVLESLVGALPYRHTVVCPACRKVSSTETKESTLILPYCASFREAIAAAGIGRTERIEYTCEACGMRSAGAESTLTVDDPSAPVFCVYVKRTDAQRTAPIAGIDLRFTSDANGRPYVLRAVSVAVPGHHYAFVRHAHYGWYRVDDERITAVADAAKPESLGHVYFYERQ